MFIIDNTDSLKNRESVPFRILNDLNLIFFETDFLDKFEHEFNFFVSVLINIF